MKNKLSNEEFAKRFDSVAESYDKILNPYAVSRRYNEIVQSLNGNCLEIGAGTGTQIPKKYNKKKYVLSDISIKMCEVSKNKHDCRVVCCDAEQLPFADDSFDSIVSSESIHYLSNPRNFIIEANRVLKKNGILILSFANQDVVIFDKIRAMLRLLGFNKMYFDDGLRSFFKFADLKMLLGKNNFRIKTRKRIVMFPFKFLHYLNLIIERTFLGYFCVFNFLVAEKISK